jgi:hypothetical protein
LAYLNIRLNFIAPAIPAGPFIPGKQFQLSRIRVHPFNALIDFIRFSGMLSPG